MSRSGLVLASVLQLEVSVSRSVLVFQQVLVSRSGLVLASALLAGVGVSGRCRCLPVGAGVFSRCVRLGRAKLVLASVLCQCGVSVSVSRSELVLG